MPEERPTSGGRWNRDPDTGALAPDLPQTPTVPVEVESPDPEASPARRQKKGD